MCYVLIDQVGLKKNFLTLFFWFFVLENVPLMTDSVSMLERSNILVLRKELNEKDRNLKIQLLIATKMEKNLSVKRCFWKMDFLRMLNVILIFLK